jgi:hypothetical protein
MRLCVLWGALALGLLALTASGPGVQDASAGATIAAASVDGAEVLCSPGGGVEPLVAPGAPTTHESSNADTDTDPAVRLLSGEAGRLPGSLPEPAASRQGQMRSQRPPAPPPKPWDAPIEVATLSLPAARPAMGAKMPGSAALPAPTGLLDISVLHALRDVAPGDTLSRAPAGAAAYARWRGGFSQNQQNYGG